METSDPRAVAWSVELRSTGRVCADVRRWRALVYLLVGLWMLAIAAGLLAFTGVAGRLFGAFLLVVTLGLVTVSVQQLLRIGSWRSPQVLVDEEGITVRHGWLRVPWSELYGASGYTMQFNRWVALVLTEECYEAWRAGRPRWVQLLSRRPRRWRHGTVQLPPNLGVDPEAFAAWLTHEARRRVLADIEARRSEWS